jgi:hypothetical protein
VKTCFKCGRALPLGEFYRHPMMGDGHLGKCKDCAKRDVRANRDARLEQYRAYDRSRPRRESPSGSAFSKKTRRLHAAALRAHPIPQPCAKCGAPGAHRHHPDYSKPTLIEWLCTGCHGREHSRLRRERA